MNQESYFPRSNLRLVPKTQLVKKQVLFKKFDTHKHTHKDSLTYNFFSNKTQRQETNFYHKVLDTDNKRSSLYYNP